MLNISPTCDSISNLKKPWVPHVSHANGCQRSEEGADLKLSETLMYIYFENPVKNRHTSILRF